MLRPIMKRAWPIVLIILLAMLTSALSYGQTGVGGGGQSNVSGGGSGNGGVGGTFNLASYGAVDDDATDNCANGSIAAFTAAVNAYSGPGIPIAAIYPTSATPKQTYKLATPSNSCTFAFTRASGVSVQVWANIDCAQTAQSCMQLGPSGQSSESALENYTVTGNGLFLGGANLTLAGIYVEPGVNQFHISGLRFGRDDNTGTSGFGASNATLGNCTNYSIYVDSPVADGWIDHVLDFVAAASTTSGGCGLANPNGAASGTNTVYFDSNLVGTAGAVGGGTQCGSTAILDGGSYGSSISNNIYGFGIPIRIQGAGHRIIGNQVDNAGCVAHGVGAAFQVGAAGSSTAVGPITIESNTLQVYSGHSTSLFSQAGDTTASFFSLTIIGNQNVNVGGGNTASGSLVPSSVSCSVNSTSGNGCYVAGNQGFLNPAPGVTNNGWYNAIGDLGTLVPAVQSANLSATTLVTVPMGITAIVRCLVVETVRDSTSSTLPACVVSYTDGFTSVATSQTITATNTTNVVGASQSGYAVIQVGSGAVQISTTGYASNVASTMHYQVVAVMSGRS